MADDEKDLDMKLADNIVTLPEYIDFDSYRETVKALSEALASDSSAPVYLLCQGNGGDVKYAFALCEMVARSPRVVGVLLGYAGSGNSGVWAACQTRLYGDYGHLLIHGAQNEGGGAVTDLRLDLAITEYQSRAVASIYARASNKDLDYWLAYLEKARQSAVLLTPDDLAKYQMGVRLEIDIFANPA